jgi:hypothetical protein
MVVTMDAAHRAFDAGDFREARRLARELRAQAPDEATRAAASELLRRTAIDPVILWVTVACVLLFVGIVIGTLR